MSQPEALADQRHFHLHGLEAVGQRLVPNIGRENQAIADLDPVLVQRWITSADPDLEGLTPLGWLNSGRDVKAVLKVVPEA